MQSEPAEIPLFCVKRYITLSRFTVRSTTSCIFRETGYIMWNVFLKCVSVFHKYQKGNFWIQRRLQLFIIVLSWTPPPPQKKSESVFWFRIKIKNAWIKRWKAWFSPISKYFFGKSLRYSLNVLSLQTHGYFNNEKKIVRSSIVLHCPKQM